MEVLKKNVKFISAQRIYPDGLRPMLVSGGQVVLLSASLANGLVADGMATFTDKVDIDEEVERLARVKEAEDRDPTLKSRNIAQGTYREPDLGTMNFKTPEVLAQELKDKEKQNKNISQKDKDAAAAKAKADAEAKDKADAEAKDKAATDAKNAADKK
jgi:hypothetical protein